MIVHRLARAPFAALDGDGARLFGGRWNTPGRPMVYTAVNPSLAVLEVMVHLDLPPDLMPDDYRLLSIELPEGAAREVLHTVPPTDGECAAAGDDFLRRHQALTLTVPSVLVPRQHNILINPRHPQAADLRVVGDEAFRFDPRLLGAGRG